MRPYVIGKAGEMIQRLQQETQTKLNIPKMVEGETPVHEDDGTRIEITIEGDVEGIEIVKRKIEAIVAEKVQPSQFQEIWSSRTNHILDCPHHNPY